MTEPKTVETKWSFPAWQPQDDLVLILSDKRGESRSEGELHDVIEDVRETLRKHDFDVSSAGTREAMAKFLSGHTGGF